VYKSNNAKPKWKVIKLIGLILSKSIKYDRSITI